MFSPFPRFDVDLHFVRACFLRSYYVSCRETTRNKSATMAMRRMMKKKAASPMKKGMKKSMRRMMRKKK